MRFFKFTFAVLALISIFTACTKEEFAPQQEMQNTEFPGAKIIGTNLSADFTYGMATKVDAEGSWTEGDKLGLAWAPVTATAGTTWAQDSTTAVGDNLYANNMYFLQDGEFITYGNIYEGWNFGYFPYARMNKTGDVKKVVVNPDQEEAYEEDIFKTRLHLSAKQYLTEANVVNDQLVNGHFALYRAVKALKVNVNPVDEIKNNDILNGLEIKSVEFKSTLGNKPFISNGVEMEIKPSVLANVVYTEVENSDPVEYEYKEQATAEAFFTSLNTMTAAYTTATYRDNTVSTNVEKAKLNLTSAQDIRFYLLPYAAPAGAVIKANGLSLKVNVQNGFFLVEYTEGEDEDLSTIERNNNTAFTKLVQLYTQPKAGDDKYVGYMRKFSAAYEEAKHVGLNFTLTADMFHEQFVIEKESDWNKAVEIVDEFGKEEVEFTIKQGTTLATKWAFTEEIKLPKTAKLTVLGDEMILAKQGANWPSTGDKFVVKTNIEVKKDLNVTGKMNTTGTIFNKAIINAGAQSQITNLNNSASTARVVVAYGAKVNATAAGIVSYVVNEVSEANIARINKLIALDDLTPPLTPVNTLTVDGVTLDLNATAKSSDDDVYKPSPNDKIDNLSDINIELVNGGALMGDFYDQNIVNKVTALGGTAVNAINNVKPTYGLFVNAGELNATDAILDNTISLTIKKNATLNLNSSVAKVYEANAINNEGTFNSNVKVFIVNTIDNSEGTLNVNTDTNCKLYYKNSYEQGGSAKGWILEAKATAPSASLTPDGEGVYHITSAADLLYLSTIDIKGMKIKLANDIDMAGINWTGMHVNSADYMAKTIFDGNNKTIKNLTGNCGLFSKIYVDVKNVKLENVVIYSDEKFVGAVVGQAMSSSTDLSKKSSINNVSVNGAIITGCGEEEKSEKYGVVVGLCYANVSNTTVNNATVTGVYKDAGAIAGCVAGNGLEIVFDNCDVVSSNIYARNNAGALVGRVYENCKLTFTNTCSVTNTTPSVFYGKKEGVVVLNN